MHAYAHIATCRCTHTHTHTHTHCDIQPFVQCYTNVTCCGGGAAPFAPTIVMYYLMAILSIEHDSSQKLNLEAVATVASKLANRVC